MRAIRYLSDMNKYQKLLSLLLALSIIAGGIALWASAYTHEINDKSEASYDRVYDAITTYGK